MGKLHELLAVRQDRRNQANSTISKATDLFKNKQELFHGLVEKFVPRGENESESIENTKEMAYAVNLVLVDVMETWARAANVEGTIDSTNAKGSPARANVFQGYTTQESGWLQDVPAMYLLNLEKDLGAILSLFQSIPTLDPTKKWEKEGQYHKTVSERERSRKMDVPIVLHDPTPEHPAQTQLVSRDVVIGKVVRTEFSSEFTMEEKDRLVKRCQALIVRVKEARARANSCEEDTQSYGDDASLFLLG